MTQNKLVSYQKPRSVTMVHKQQAKLCFMRVNLLTGVWQRVQTYDQAINDTFREVCGALPTARLRAGSSR